MFNRGGSNVHDEEHSGGLSLIIKIDNTKTDEKFMTIDGFPWTVCTFLFLKFQVALSHKIVADHLGYKNMGASNCV